MTDFSSLLKGAAGNAKKPPALPAGDYPAIIKNFELGDANKNRTPYVRLTLGLQGFPESVSAEDREGVDLSKRQPRRDYYLTDDALWRLDELIRDLGIEAAGRSYEEVIPELVGQQVLAELQQKLNQNTNETFTEVVKLVPLR